MGTLALSTLMAVIGLALIGQAVSKAGVLSPRMILGLLFVAAGALRVYLIFRRDREA
jgi:hypothetical protein